MNNADNKRIAKNTLFLYFRMLLILFVSLFTARVTLQVLGVDDFGIYQTVGGVVTFLTFISNALGTGTSRFITFEMGKEKPRLDSLFATVRLAHIVLAVLIVIVGEVIGLWFIYHKLVIPPERLDAAVFAFHFSMATTFFQITQVPYNAVIIAYERMNVYAYVSIIEAVLKLVIVYILLVLNYDKLKVYSVLIGVISVLIVMIYRIYCRINFQEVSAKLSFEKEIFRSIASFSGWSMFTSSASSFANQGVTIVVNMFFSPSVVTLRTLALRVNNIMMQFISNFRTAVNPQVVKKYAAGEYEESKNLVLSTTKYTFYLTLLIALPLFLLIEPALQLWLGDVPDGLVLFTRLALGQGLFQVFDTSLYSAIYANGRIRENAIISAFFDFGQLPVIYILFKLGFPPIVLAWTGLICYMIIGMLVKPLLVHYIVGYNLKEIYVMFSQCFLVLVIASVLPVIVFLNINYHSVMGFIIVLFLCLLTVVMSVWICGIDKKTRRFVLDWGGDKYRQIVRKHNE